MRFITIFLLILALFPQVLLNPVQAEEPIISEVYDVDDNGEKEALSDGLLVLSYLFDFRGEAVILPLLLIGVIYV